MRPVRAVNPRSSHASPPRRRLVPSFARPRAERAIVPLVLEEYDGGSGNGECVVHGGATVIVTSVVGFGTLSERLPPEAVHSLLEALWQRFGQLATAHGVLQAGYQLDRYTCVVGVRPLRPDHAAAACRFALDLHAAAAATRLEDGTPLCLRVGLATGPLASSPQPASCDHQAQRARAPTSFFGAAVNCAARLERGCEPGGVRLSLEAAQAAGLLPEQPAPPALLRTHADTDAFQFDAAGADAAAVRCALDAAVAAQRSASSPMPTSGGIYAHRSHLALLAAKENGALLAAEENGAEVLGGGGPQDGAYDEADADSDGGEEGPRHLRGNDAFEDDGEEPMAGRRSLFDGSDDAQPPSGSRSRRLASLLGSSASLDGGGGGEEGGHGPDHSAPAAPPRRLARASLPCPASASPPAPPSSSLRRSRTLPAPGGSGISAAAAADAAEAAAAAEAADAALEASAVTYLAGQVWLATFPVLFGALGSAMDAARWRERGGAQAVAFAESCRAPLAVLFVAQACGTGGVLLWQRRRMPSHAASHWRHLRIRILLGVLVGVACLGELFFAAEWHLLRADNCGSLASAACSTQFFWIGHVRAMGVVVFIAQLPVGQLFALEAARSCTYLAAALAAAASDPQGIAPAFAMASCLRSLGSWLVLSTFWGVAYTPNTSVVALLAASGVDTCPPPLRRLRRRVEKLAAWLRCHYLHDRVVLETDASVTMCILALVAVTRFLTTPFQQPCAGMAQGAVSSRGLAIVVSDGFLSLLLSSALARFRAGSSMSLVALDAAAASACAERQLAGLRTRLGACAGEAAILRVGADAAAALFPGAVALALAAFAEGSAPDVVALQEVASRTPEGERAIRAALPPHVGAIGGGATTSVARVCHPTSNVALLDSADLRGGLGACEDWAAALEGGLDSTRAITAPLHAGPVVVGFIQLHFAPPSRGARLPSRTALRELCDAVGGAIFIRRAFAIAPGAASGAGVGPTAVHNVSPAWSRMPVHTPRMAASQADPAAERVEGIGRTLSSLRLSSHFANAPSEADAAALAELDASLEADVKLLSSWSLDPWSLQDEDVPRLLVATLHATGLLRRYRISPALAQGFAASLGSSMPAANPFHNVRHVLAVTATAFRFITQSEGCREALEDMDVLALLLSAMCHDLEHPGTTNAYQVNTGSALALRYNDTSVLENHHAATAFALLSETGLLHALSAHDARSFRRRVLASILATDMAKHKELLTNVSARVEAARRIVAAEATTAREPGGAAQPGLEFGDGGGGESDGFSDNDIGGPVRSSGGGGGPTYSPIERRSSMPNRLGRRGSGGATGALDHRGSLEKQRFSGASVASRDSAALSGGHAGSPPRGSQTSMSAGAAGDVASSRLLLTHAFSDSTEDRQLLVAFLLHCADLCTPLLPPAVSQRCCNDLAREFDAQAALERAAGLPVTVMLAPDALGQGAPSCVPLVPTVRTLTRRHFAPPPSAHRDELHPVCGAAPVRAAGDNFAGLGLHADSDRGQQGALGGHHQRRQGMNAGRERAVDCLDSRFLMRLSCCVCLRARRAARWRCASVRAAAAAALPSAARSASTAGQWPQRPRAAPKAAACAPAPRGAAATGAAVRRAPPAPCWANPSAQPPQPSAQPRQPPSCRTRTARATGRAPPDSAPPRTQALRRPRSEPAGGREERSDARP